MKNNKYIFLIAVALCIGNVANAQLDTLEVEEEVIIDTKGIKVVVKEKNTVSTVDEKGDSVNRKTETIEIRTTRDEDIAFEEEIEISQDVEIIEDEPFVETSWNNFHLGLNNLLNNQGQLEADGNYGNMGVSPSNSINFQWDIVSQAMNLYKGKVRLIYGVGIDYNNYRFTESITLDKDSDPLTVTEDVVDYDKNKLVTKHLNVPFLLNFKIAPKRSDEYMYISGGANLGYLIGSHQKQKWSDNGKKKNKLEDDYNLAQFRVGYEVQFGYKNVVLFGKYFPNSIFKSNQGPDLRTVSAGILIGKV